MTPKSIAKVQKMITQLIEITKQDPDFGIFISAIKTEGREFDGVAYANGGVLQAVNALCFGISSLMDTVQEAGVDRKVFMDGLITTAKTFDQKHVAAARTEGSMRGPAGNA